MDWKHRLGQAMSQQIYERKRMNAMIRMHMPVDVIGDVGSTETLSNKTISAEDASRAVRDFMKADKCLKLAKLQYPEATEDAILTAAIGSFQRMSDTLLQEAIDTFDAECKCGVLRRTCVYHKIQ